MDIWVVMDSWECEFDFTTHLTERGALIELCTRVLLYMDSQFSPDAQSLAEPRGDSLTELWKNTLKDNMSGYDGSWLSFDINNWREQSKEELWKSLLVPATEIKMRANFRLPRKNFLRSYRVKVSNCDLTVKVWKRNCVFDMLTITTHQRVVHKTMISKVPVPKLLEKVLKDFDFWSYPS